MKIIAAFAAGLLAVSGLAATPADARPRYGYDGYGRGWQGDRGWHGDRGWRGDRWDRGRGWRGDRGRSWRGDYRRGGYRTVCDVRPGYYGPVRQCFRVRR